MVGCERSGGEKLRLDEFRLEWEASGRAEATASNYLRILLEAEVKLADGVEAATKAQVAGWMVTLTPQKRLYALRALRAWYRFAEVEDPTKSLPFPRVDETPQVTVEPCDVVGLIEELLGQSDDWMAVRDAAVIAVLSASGMRISECTRLSVDDIDLSRGAVTILLSKSRKMRVTGLDELAIEALSAWLVWRDKFASADSGLALWISGRGGRPVGKLALQRRLAAHGLVAHGLRRGLAVDWMRRGGSETSLMRLAGWSSPVMISRYTRALGEELALDEYQRLRVAS